MEGRQDYGATLNLPKTDFPMRGNLTEREPYLLDKADETQLYAKVLEKNKFSGKKFILHDGPPYANGNIHMGHALNKILKDIVVRYKTMNGYYAPFVPGWDTHGLPIERKVQEIMSVKKDDIGAIKFRDLCRDYALEQIENQAKQFKRLGGLGDYANRYVTLNPSFESKQVDVFGQMYKKGYIYRGLKPVYWCRECETALAEAEIEYSDDVTHSVYVKFKVKEDPNNLFEGLGTLDDIFFVIWTTTAWTLPGNQAITVSPVYTYAVVKANYCNYIIAKDLVETVMKKADIENYEIIKEIPGKDLENIICRHPFVEKTSRVILGSEKDLHVTLDAGTGCVHTAPGHGHEDYLVCKRYGDIEITVPVDGKGFMTEEAGIFAGMPYYEATNKIISFLKETGYIIAEDKFTHSYPHCWRCRQPVIYRATTQWFASVEGFRKEALEKVNDVKWIPSWGKERMTNMIKDRSDWCISRQRTWGVPLPIFYCESCNKELVNDATIDIVKSLFREKGSRAWFEMSANDMLKYRFTCESCGHQSFKKETDIMDVWFDSGSTHAAVLEAHEDMGSPADMYLEGNDQYRGWFQSSLLTSVATKSKAPYKQVLTHGWVVDGEGKKMSKSLGNGVDPMEIVGEYGADILRLWSVCSDYHSDVRVSKEILNQTRESYKKIRNTCRFILGNLYDFSPDANMVEYKHRDDLDKNILLKLAALIEKVNKAYEEYEFHTVFNEIHKFCSTDLSSGYLDVVKDRLYTLTADSIFRRMIQSTMYEILITLTKLVAPILVFTSEEIWSYINFKSLDSAEACILSNWPKNKPEYENKENGKKFEKIEKLKDEIIKIIEVARKEKVIGHSLAAKVIITADGDEIEFIEANQELLRMILIVSQVEVQPGEHKVEVLKADGEKCERCWTYSATVGENRIHPSLCSRCIENLPHATDEATENK